MNRYGVICFYKDISITFHPSPDKLTFYCINFLSNIETITRSIFTSINYILYITFFSVKVFMLSLEGSNYDQTLTRQEFSF